MMKALLLSDEINQFHCHMLKSVLLVLSLLPVSYLLLNLWQGTEGSSQIMIGFMAISIFSAIAIIGFYGALKATVHEWTAGTLNALESAMVKAYRTVPMLSYLAMMSYLVTQI